jgi:hypothetical protein
MADRTGQNGEKILHVEEIQSDWGQKGKKEGFAPSANKTEKYTYRHDPEDDVWDILNPQGELVEVVLSEQEARDAARQFGQGANIAVPNGGKPPTAPYVTNTQAWTDLALKRALKEAAEGGYDKLVWTPGAEQAKRYSLSTHIDEVQYSPGRNGTFSVEAYKGNNNVFNKPNATAKEIADTFGQEIAEKITSGHGEVNRNTGYNVLSGLDLETGGKGMKGYYDKIVPTQLSKLVKKLDPEARIGLDAIGSGKYEVVLPNGKVIAEYPEKVSADIIARKQPGATVRQNATEVPSLTITPKMREAIMKGQTEFARGGTIPFGPEAARSAVRIAKQQAGRR